ncbi:MAG: NTP transferase domain-containing protein [Bacteroidota bacterium]
MNAFAGISCIVLSAGSSGRMGKHKALLGFGNQGITFLEEITAKYAASGIDRIVVVVSADLNEQIGTAHLRLPEGVILVVNHHPEKGRFFSLREGMKYIEEGSSVFFQNVDNPFVYPDLLNEMAGVAAMGEIIAPVHNSKAGHPILINHRVCKAVKEDLNPETRIDHFLAKFKRIPVITDDCNILVNINSPGDYALVFPEALTDPQEGGFL